MGKARQAASAFPIVSTAASIMPPMTGGRYDVARAGALAGVVTLGLLIAGCVILRRRNTSPLDR